MRVGPKTRNADFPQGREARRTARRVGLLVWGSPCRPGVTRRCPPKSPAPPQSVSASDRESSCLSPSPSLFSLSLSLSLARSLSDQLPLVADCFGHSEAILAQVPARFLRGDKRRRSEHRRRSRGPRLRTFASGVSVSFFRISFLSFLDVLHRTPRSRKLEAQNGQGCCFEFLQMFHAGHYNSSLYCYVTDNAQRHPHPRTHTLSLNLASQQVASRALRRVDLTLRSHPAPRVPRPEAMASQDVMGPTGEGGAVKKAAGFRSTLRRAERGAKPLGASRSP